MRRGSNCGAKWGIPGAGRGGGRRTLPVPGREAVGAVCPEMDSWTEMGRSSAFAFSIVIGRARRNAQSRAGGRRCQSCDAARVDG